MKICLDWIIVILFLFIILNLKGLCIFILNSEIYTITFKCDDYVAFLKSIIYVKVNFLAAITAILSAFISIAIPLSLNQISSVLKDYNDKEISEMFFSEPAFLRMISVPFFLLLSLIIWS